MDNNEMEPTFTINGWIVFWFAVSLCLDYAIVKGIWALCKLF